MNCVLLNVQGLVSKNVNKLETPEIKSLFLNNDILCFTETWSNESTNMSVEGYNLFSLHRTDKKINSKRDSGGIACYVKNYLLKYIDLYASDSDDIIWLKCNSDLFNIENDVYLCLCYVVPKNSSREAFIETDVYTRILNYMSVISNETNDQCNFMVTVELGN